MEFMKINLQLFADAGSVVNTTGGYVNAYTGTNTPFDGTNSLSSTMKTYYDTELLENSRTETYFGQFGIKQHLPVNKGKTVEWRKWVTLPHAEVLKEGVIPEGKKLSQISLNDTIDQYGIYVTISDVLELRAVDDAILGAVDELSASAAETIDTLIRDSLLETPNVFYCDNITLETGKSSGTPKAPNEMEATDLVLCKMTPDSVNRVATYLKKHKVPRIDGKYVAIIHPSVAYDLRANDGWTEVHKYAATTEIFNGEIGELHGVRFVETTNAPILRGEYANKAGTVTYATYFFGADAWGIIDPAEGGLEMIIKNRGEVGGPLEQFSTVGYKVSTNGAKVLYPERVVRVMSCSSYSGIDEAN